MAEQIFRAKCHSDQQNGLKLNERFELFCTLIVPSGGGSVGGAINRSNSKEEVSVFSEEWRAYGCALIRIKCVSCSQLLRLMKHSLSGARRNWINTTVMSMVGL